MKKCFVHAAAVLLAVVLLFPTASCGKRREKESQPEASRSSESSAPDSRQEKEPEPSAGETPESAARLAFDAFCSLDWVQTAKYMEGMDRVSSFINEDTERAVKEITRELTCTIGEATVTDSTATLPMEITNRDFSGAVTSLIPSILLMAATNPDWTQEELTRAFAGKLADQLEKTSNELVTRTVEVTLHQSGDIWKVHLDADTADALFGGLLGEVGQFAQQLPLK